MSGLVDPSYFSNVARTFANPVGKLMYRMLSPKHLGPMYKVSLAAFIVLIWSLASEFNECPFETLCLEGSLGSSASYFPLCRLCDLGGE